MLKVIKKFVASLKNDSCVSPNINTNVVFHKIITRDFIGKMACLDGILDQDDFDRFYEISKQFNTKTYKVVSVHFIVNPKLHSTYEKFKQYLKKNHNSACDEILVFHGTLKKNINGIIENGFKIGGIDNHPPRTGHIYGKGIYCSTECSTPVCYSPNNCLIGLKGLPGEVQKHHTVMTSAHNETWYIFHSVEQTLPLYIVYFSDDNRYQSLNDPLLYRPGDLENKTLEESAAVSIAMNVLSHNNLSSKSCRLLKKELMRMFKIQMNTHLRERCWLLNVDKLDRLDVWYIDLCLFDKKLPLFKDMEKKGIKNEDKTLQLEIIFLDGYPFIPPFVRIIRPRLLRHLHGGGGHVTAGGSICMEILTTSGWNSDITVEGLLNTIYTLIMSEKPAARLAANYDVDYDFEEAKSAYKRVAQDHSWTPINI